ncbi:DUF4910 domain-containing protein [Acetobacter sp. LMG 1636]|uniref:DUF4910 domain-containing protein n=2 Tax=Acetobacter fallax TaxID=1737473 RepID=A0ABX0KGX1_9PROT|nr:DUF4910 domain-containing protein [Acetobacter fallax]NHO36502.1 DUF4910 domain-containing protein [Acetobacter fallax]
MLNPRLYPELRRATSPDALFRHVEALFPILRSITGEGIRQTLDYISERTREFITVDIPSGTPVLDWNIPDEWNVKAATIRTCNGDIVVDLAASNLHILQYSVPFHGRVSKEVLFGHLFSLPEQPDLIPYKTSYYIRNWGFCVSENQKASLTDPEYDIDIDASLEPGHLTYGEVLIAGRSDEEIFFSVHCCHPSLANDNLSSIAIAIELIRTLQATDHLHFSYRFVFVPGTIGAIAWLAKNIGNTQKIRNGLVLSCLGDKGGLTYKKSRNEDASTNRYLEWLIEKEPDASVREFEPYGYDERQYCSPGFNLPVGCLMRSPNGMFPEYHTSADNLDFVQPVALLKSYNFIARFISMLENDFYPVSRYPFGEPQLGRRGLYPLPAAPPDITEDDADWPDQMSILWVLNLSDGHHSLFDMARQSGKSLQTIILATGILEKADLLDIHQFPAAV